MLLGLIGRVFILHVAVCDSCRFVLFFCTYCVCVFWLKQLVPPSSESAESAAGGGFSAGRVDSQAADRRRSQPLLQSRDVLQHQVPHCEYPVCYMRPGVRLCAIQACSHSGNIDVTGWKNHGQAVYYIFNTMAASSGKRNVTVWRPSVRLSVCPIFFLTLVECAVLS